MAGESRGEEKFSRDDMETIFARRQTEHRHLLEEMVELIRPDLERMTDQIAASNHVKDELRLELIELTTAVNLSQQRLEEHSRLPSHRVGAKMISDLGLEKLSDEERGIFPEVMRAAVIDKKMAATADKTQGRRVDMQMVIATAVGSLASLLMFGVALLAFVVSKGSLP